MKRFCISLLLSLFIVSPILAYEVAEIKDGGTIKGHVRFSGSVPVDEVIKIDRDTEVCGNEQKAGKFIISNNGVKNAVVWIEGIKKGKAFSSRDVEILIKNCNIVPLVSTGFVGGRFVFKNEDPILHTIQLKLSLEYHKSLSQRPLEDGATIYNIALPRKGMRVEKPIKEYHAYSKETGYMKVKSNAHSWLRGYIFIFDHPYGTVTDDNGSFMIDNIPPGEYTLMVWHEGLGLKEKKITIHGGRVEDVEIDLSK